MRRFRLDTHHIGNGMSVPAAVEDPEGDYVLYEEVEDLQGPIVRSCNSPFGSEDDRLFIGWSREDAESIVLDIDGSILPGLTDDEWALAKRLFAKSSDGIMAQINDVLYNCVATVVNERKVGNEE